MATSTPSSSRSSAVSSRFPKGLQALTGSPRRLLVVLLVGWFALSGLVLGGLALALRSNADSGKVTHFSSCEDLATWLSQRPVIYYNNSKGGQEDQGSGAPMPTVSGAGQDHSQTNVQVAGVDESDIVKTDGKYEYTVDLANEEVAIYDVGSDKVSKVGKIDLDFPETAQLFLSRGKLVITKQATGKQQRVERPYINEVATSVDVYDVSDPTHAKNVKSIRFDGSYHTARISGDTLYVLADYSLNSGLYGSGSLSSKILTQLLPTITVDKSSPQQLAACDQIGYYGTGLNNVVLTNMVALSLSDLGKYSTNVFMGSIQDVYMSEHNLYVASTEYPAYQPVPVPTCDWWQNLFSGCVNVLPLNSDSVLPTTGAEGGGTSGAPAAIVAPSPNDPKTLLHKIALSGVEAKYVNTVSVSGVVLNQFSMDEWGNTMRIATSDSSGTNVYTFDDSLKQLGSLEHIARGQQMYAARYVGSRVYLVTFRRVDPLHVVDVSDAKNPTEKGELKIPGYSVYLHPYDDTHLIGVGREVTATGAQGGIKVGMFDVSKPSAPKQISTFTIGSAATYSPILDNHKAFLFDRERNLLVIPTSDQIFTPIFYAPDAPKSSISPSQSVKKVFKFNVFNVNATQGITLRSALTMEAGEAATIPAMRALRVGERLITSVGEGELDVFDLASLQLLQRTSGKETR